MQERGSGKDHDNGDEGEGKDERLTKQQCARTTILEGLSQESRRPDGGTRTGIQGGSHDVGGKPEKPKTKGKAKNTAPCMCLSFVPFLWRNKARILQIEDILN